MKKLFTLCLLLCLVATGANAKQRKTWDFTKGFSDATIQQLAADVAAAKGWTEETVGQSYQCGSRTAKTELTANGSVIAETQGLQFGSASSKHVIIAYNYTKTAFAYKSFLWLNGATTSDYVTIPKVAPGQTIAITHESHSTTVARGFTCTTTGVTKVSGDETSMIGTVTTVYKVDATNTDSIAVTFKTSVGGAHIQSIIIDEGDQPEVKDNAKIAYLYDSSFSGYDADNDPIKTILSEKNTTNIDIKEFSIDGKDQLTTDSLQKFDLVVVSDATVPTYNAFVPSLKKLIRYVPMINLNASLYDAWGYGKLTNPATATGSMVVVDSMKNSSLFTGINIEENGSIAMNASAFSGNYMQSYTADADSYFAKDSIYSTVDGVNAIHRHGTNKNAYMLIPLAYEGIAGNNISEDAINLFSNAISMISATKSTVTKAITPTVTPTYKDHLTTVKLSSGTADSKVYYTTDGTEPTISSNLYTGELTFTDSMYIKAIATADGYYNSDIKDYGKVAIQTQIAAPTATVDAQTGYTNLTLSDTEAGASIYFNLTGSTLAANSQLYVENSPVKFTKRATVTFFAVKSGMVTSEIQTINVTVANSIVRTDTLVHLTFNDAAWTTKVAAGSDFITGKYYNYWSTIKADSTSSTVTTANGDSLVWTYTYLPKDSLTSYDFGNGWKLESYGQRIMIQTTGSSTAINTDYGPETAFDYGATKYALSFLVTKNSGDPANAYLQSTTTYKGPFDIDIWLCGQYAAGNYEAVQVSVSKNGTDWTVLDTIGTSLLKRMHKGEVTYAGTDDVYVKIKSANAAPSKQKTMVFDVMLLGGNGGSNGVKTINGNTGSVVAEQYFSISGARLNSPAKGINIVKQIYSDGTSKTSKIIKK